MTSLLGPVFTIFTPFAKSGSIDYDALESYVDFLKQRGARQFYMMPYNGRYSQLSFNEVEQLNTVCIRTVKADPSCVIIVSDPIHGSTEAKLNIAKQAAKAGADYFSSIMREKYFSHEQVVQHYELMTKAGVPLVAHAMPFLSGFDGRSMDWPNDLFGALRNVSGVVAIKEDSKLASLSRQLISDHGDRFDIVVAGSKRYLLDVMAGPQQSYINGISMLDPRIAFKFWELLGGDDVEVERFVREVDDPFWTDLAGKYGWHRVNKASLEAAGLMSRTERMPMPELSDAEMVEVRQVVRGILSSFERWMD